MTIKCSYTLEYSENDKDIDKATQNMLLTKGNTMKIEKQKTKAEAKVVEYRFSEGDIVTYADDFFNKTEKFKIVEVVDDKLHIKMLNEPYASYLVPAVSVTKV